MMPTPTSAPRARLSVILITKNESKHIGACLESVSFADEIIVVDSGSTDDTRDIAARLGAQVHETSDWPGFGPQKNRALDLATGDWVFSIDADERVTPEMAQEIQALVQSQPALDAYQVARLSYFCGQAIRHSGWWPDHVLRLFRRGSARFTDAKVHEKLVCTTTATGVLRHHLIHYPYDSLEALLNKVNRYSSDAAGMMYARGKRTTTLGALGHGIWTFIRSYIIRRGFLDGRAGLIIAVAGGTGSFFRYSKLLMLQQNAGKPADPPQR